MRFFGRLLLAFALLLSTVPTYGTELLPEIRWQAFDNNGNPLSGAKLYAYDAGTVTPKNTYSDTGLTTPNSNPIVADSAGRFGTIFLTTGNYKFELRTSADVVVWTQDNVEGTPGTSTFGATTFTGNITMSGAAVNFAARTSVASAGTTNIGAAASNNVLITGTTTITAFDSVASGIQRDVTFAAALTLTHNGTSLILPGGANITTAANDSATFLSLGSGNWICLSYKRQSGRSIVDPSQVLQIVNTTTNAFSTGTTAIPIDDTIPQITEGDEYMTQAVTPLSTTSVLKVEVEVMGAHSATARYVCALFKDATANAIAVGKAEMAGVNFAETLSFSYQETSGSLTARTFRVRCGSSTGATFTFNGQAGAGLFGTTPKSQIRVTEYQPAAGL